MIPQKSINDHHICILFTSEKGPGTALCLQDDMKTIRSIVSLLSLVTPDDIKVTICYYNRNHSYQQFLNITK